MTFRDQIDRLRQPAHTGENRCAPCTILNVAIAAVLVAVAVGVTVSSSGHAAAAVVGTVISAVSGATIYLRGYLVPGTPWLAETVLPARVRERFGKRPSGVDDGAHVDLALNGVGATPNTESRSSPDRSHSSASRNGEAKTDGDTEMDDGSGAGGDRGASDEFEDETGGELEADDDSAVDDSTADADSESDIILEDEPAGSATRNEAEK